MNIIDQDFRERFSQKLEKLSQLESVEGVACILITFNNQDESGTTVIAEGHLSSAMVCVSFAEATNRLCGVMEIQRAQKKAASEAGVQ